MNPFRKISLWSILVVAFFINARRGFRRKCRSRSQILFRHGLEGQRYVFFRAANILGGVRPGTSAGADPAS